LYDGWEKRVQFGGYFSLIQYMPVQLVKIELLKTIDKSEKKN